MAKAAGDDEFGARVLRVPHQLQRHGVALLRLHDDAGLQSMARQVGCDIDAWLKPAGVFVGNLVHFEHVDRLGRVWTVRLTAALGVVGLVLFIFGGPAWIVLVGTVLWSIGVSMGFPLGMSAAADSGPNPAAQVSVVASIGYLANLGGPPVIGALSEQFGILGALWLVVALLGVGIAAAGALSITKRHNVFADTAAGG